MLIDESIESEAKHESLEPRIWFTSVWSSWRIEQWIWPFVKRLRSSYSLSEWFYFIAKALCCGLEIICKLFYSYQFNYAYYYMSLIQSHTKFSGIWVLVDKQFIIIEC